MIKTKLIVYAILPVLILIILDPGVASSMSFRWFGGNIDPGKTATHLQYIFQNQDQILDISVNEVKATWTDGKTIKQLIDKKGITQEQVQARMKEAQLAQLNSELNVLVDKGIITQTQTSKRLQAMQTQLQNNKGRNGGMGMFMGFGFRHRFR